MKGRYSIRPTRFLRRHYTAAHREGGNKSGVRAMTGIRNETYSLASRSGTRELALIDAATKALTEARSPAEFLEIANKAEALRQYVRRARLGLLAQNRCAELRLR